MNIISFSVKRSVAIFCLMIALIGLGFNSYRKLPLEELPKTEMPFITIMTVYPGASPDIIEADVAKPVEDAVGAIDGLKNITSSSMENACQTLLEFRIGVDVDRAANDIREKLDLITHRFPEGVEKPRVLKFDINAQPIINMAITGDRPIDDLFDYADNDFRDHISTVPGVAEIAISGGSKREIQVLLDRELLAARGLTALDIASVLKKEVKLIPVGRIKDQGLEYAIKFDADFSSFENLAGLEVANSNGQRCYIKDIGQVVMGSEERRQAAFINGKPCVAIRIIKKSDANALEVVRLVKQKTEELQLSIPGGIELVWVSDSGAYISSSVSSAISNIWQGIGLTAILMFFFLYNLKSTLTVAITMPITIITGLFFIYLLDYSLNTVTLLALGLSIGILVTNSVVVIESIVSRLKTSPDPENAAQQGTYSVVSAIIASAGTNIVVLFPISLMQGQIGQFFIPFALTMVGITVISLFVSFTLTPAMAAQFFKNDQIKWAWLQKLETGWNKGFNFFTASCLKLVKLITARPRNAVFCIIIALALFTHSLFLLPKIGFSFLPVTDRGEVIIKLEFPTSFSLDKTVERMKRVEDKIKATPHLKHRLTTAGKIDGTVGQTSEGVYLAQIMCKFSEKNDRDISIFSLSENIRSQLQDVQDAVVSITLPDQTGAGTEIKMVISGQDFAVLDKICADLVAGAKKESWLTDVDSSMRPGKNELRIFPRRAILGDLKVPAVQLGMALRTAIEGSSPATYKQNARTYNIRVKLAEKQGIEQISRMEMPGAAGYPVILENFVDMEKRQTPIMITRRNKARANMFYANPSSGMTINKAAMKIKEIAEGKNGLMPGYSVSFIGKVEAMQEGLSDFIEVGITAFILTYLLLAAILNSFSRPVIILITIPLGLTGSIWALYICGEPVSMMVLLGGVMLIGIVVNNAILIMDKVQQTEYKNQNPSETIAYAIEQEMRAITMITLAAVFGMLPMALDSGLGSELRSGIGIAAMGGIIVSAVFTLLILPAVYCLVNPDSKE